VVVVVVKIQLSGGYGYQLYSNHCNDMPGSRLVATTVFDIVLHLNESRKATISERSCLLSSVGIVKLV
jgi:hypothetical protein